MKLVFQTCVSLTSTWRTGVKGQAEVNGQVEGHLAEEEEYDYVRYRADIAREIFDGHVRVIADVVLRIFRLNSVRKKHN